MGGALGHSPCGQGALQKVRGRVAVALILHRPEIAAQLAGGKQLQLPGLLSAASGAVRGGLGDAQ